MALTTLASYRLTSCISLILARGSVLDFQGSSTTSGGSAAGVGDVSSSSATTPDTAAGVEAAPAVPPLKPTAAAIVNAANPGCLGGGGVDGAITTAGGPNLAQDRQNLPLIKIDDGFNGPEYVRCPTGSAVITGPNDYGDLLVPYVIHAVGPNYWDYCNSNGDTVSNSNDSFNDNDEDNTMSGAGGDGNEMNDEDDNNEIGIAKAHELLQSAYQTSLNLAFQNQINEIAFSLLSAGIFRGPLSRETILQNAVLAINSWAQQQQQQQQQADGGDCDEQQQKQQQQQEVKNDKNTDKDDGMDDCNNNNNSNRMKMEVTLCAFNAQECKTLQRICDEQFSSSTTTTTTATATTTDDDDDNNNDDTTATNNKSPPEEEEEEPLSATKKKRTRSDGDGNDEKNNGNDEL